MALPRILWATRLSRVGTLLVGTFVLVAVFASPLAPYDPTERVAAPLQGPSDAHLLGTNDIGQDILSELVVGTRVSLLVGVAAGGLATLLATAAGVAAGVVGRAVDATVMRTVDVVLILPLVPVLIVFAAYAGRGTGQLVLLIGALLWAEGARVIRAQALTTRERLHVEASRTFGAGRSWVARRHILPAVAPLVVMQFVHLVKLAVLLEASLSFLGLGDPTQRSWGTIIYYATARGAFLTGSWRWWIVPPGVCVALLIVGFALIGTRLEELADPRLRRIGGVVTGAT